MKAKGQIRGHSVRELMWMLKAPPVARRQRLWTLRNRIGRHATGYRGPWKSPWLPNKRKPRLLRPIHTEESREADREGCYE